MVKERWIITLGSCLVLAAFVHVWQEPKYQILQTGKKNSVWVLNSVTGKLQYCRLVFKDVPPDPSYKNRVIHKNDPPKKLDPRDPKEWTDPLLRKALIELNYEAPQEYFTVYSKLSCL